MAQVEPVFEEIPEFIDIADKVITRYPTEFGNIDVAKIACVGITNKERSEKKTQLWEIKPIKPPVNIFCPKEYIVVFYQKDWDEMSDKHRALIVSDVLCSIPPDGKGNLQSMDYKDHSKMLRTFGVDYMDRNDVPDILVSDVDWKK
jgi:hypothetical protein